MKKSRVLIHGTQSSTVTVENGATVGARFSKNIYDEDGNVLSLAALIAMAQGAAPPTVGIAAWSTLLYIPQNVKALENATGATGMFAVTGPSTGALRTMLGPMSVDVTDGDGVGGAPVFVLDGDDPNPGLGYSYATHLTTGAKGWFRPALFESTGVLDGGTLSINAGDNTKFDVAQTVVGSTDYSSSAVGPQRAAAVFGPQLANSVPSLAVIATYVGIQMPSGTLVMQSSPFTPTQTRTIAPLGAVISNGVNLTAVNNLPGVMRAGINQIQDLMGAIGPMNLSGNVVGPNGANLNINKSAGVIFKQGANFTNDEDNPHELNLAALTPATFAYRLSNGTQFATTSSIDPNNYESPLGTLTAVPAANRFTIQRFAVFTSNLIRVQYGQFDYGSMASAEAALATEAFVTEQNIADNGLLLGFLIVRDGATDLSNASDAKFVPASKFGGPVGSGGTSITNTDALPEGSVNLYFTNARAISSTAGTYQPLDGTLTALASQNWVLNALPIGSGADTVSQVAFAANTFPARASTGNLVAKTITDFGLSLVDDADASAGRTTLGALSKTGDTATGNYNFDSGVLFIDATNNRVGVNTALPQRSFHAVGAQGVVALFPSAVGVNVPMVLENNGSANFSLVADPSGSAGLACYESGSSATNGFFRYVFSSDSWLTDVEGTTRSTLSASGLVIAGTIRPNTYTVATLPSAGLVAGMRATVSDATAPTYLGTLTGGGSVTCGVLYNGTAWVST